MKYFLGAFLFFASVVIAAPPLNTDAQLSSDFTKFVDQYFDSALQWRPSSATILGVHSYDSKADDYSAEAFAKRISTLKLQQLQMEAFRAAPLTEEQRIDLDLIENRILSSLLDLEVLKTWQTNPMSYASAPSDGVDGLIKREFAPAHERLKSVIARLAAVPAVMQAMKKNVVNPPKEHTELAISIAEGSVAFLQDEVGEWGKRAAGGDAKLKSAFLDVDKKAVQAVKEGVEWLKNDLLPRSTGAYSIGKENFLRMLQYDDRVTLPLEKLGEVAAKQMARDHAEFVAVAHRIDPSKTPIEVMKAMSLDHPAEGKLSGAAKATLAGIEQFVISHKIVKLPHKTPPVVKDTPSFMRAGGFAMMDTPGPFEQKTSTGFYYVLLPKKTGTSSIRRSI